MSHLLPTTSLTQPAECIPSHGRQHWSGPQGTPIHILSNDALLSVFSLCRPVFLYDDEAEDNRNLEGGDWGDECWWYKLVHVCRRWRYLIFGSPSYLRLCLVCTTGTPVAHMLANSPPLPLIIDHILKDQDHDITAEDEEGILLVLQHHHHRVQRIRLEMPVPNLQKLVTAMDEEFPMLEFLYITAPTEQDASLVLPQTFQAPHLRHLVLDNVICPITSPLLMPTTGLVTLSLMEIRSSANLRPHDLLQRLALMPQLETLGIDFHSPISSRDIERQLRRMPIVHVTLPNLRWFGFRGVSAYLEALLPRITAPLLEKLQILFFNQLTFSVPHLLEFIRSAENLRFSSARVTFHDGGIFTRVYPHEGAKMYALYVDIGCKQSDWQVASAVQILNTLRSVFSSVEHLSLEYEMYAISSEWHNKADHAQWRKLLESFNDVKTLLVDAVLVRDLSHSLQLDDGEPLPVELLPELKEVSYSAIDDADDVFTPFIDARQKAGRPVTLVRRNTSPSESPG
ncbi:hypothetical protein V8E52_007004 [Russula decolorans]